MSPEQQQAAIAKVCNDLFFKNAHGVWCFMSPDLGRVEWNINDLNACHEMEQVLTPKYQPAKGESQWSEYLGWLGFFGENKTREVYECVRATAAQRAQAFLRTLGLWQESSTPTQPQ
jgi:hypothetical protein